MHPDTGLVEATAELVERAERDGVDGSMTNSATHLYKDDASTEGFAAMRCAGSCKSRPVDQGNEKRRM